MPLTPRVFRPMARAWASSKRMAMPWRVLKHHLVARLRQDHVDERIAFVETDADDAAALGPAVLVQRRLLDQAAPRGHQQVLLAARSARTGMTLVIFSSALSDSTLAMARPGLVRLICGMSYTLSQYSWPAVGEAEQIGVRGGNEEVLDEVVLARARRRKRPCRRGAGCGRC